MGTDYKQHKRKRNKPIQMSTTQNTLTGRITTITAEESGQSKAGKTWRKRTVVIETDGQYPKLVALTQFGDAIDKTPLNEGDTVTVYIDIESREYGGKYYTDVKAYRVDVAQSGYKAPLAECKPDADDSDSTLPF
jgi:ribosomal protein S1